MKGNVLLQFQDKL